MLMLSHGEPGAIAVPQHSSQTDFGMCRGNYPCAMRGFGFDRTASEGDRKNGPTSSPSKSSLHMHEPLLQSVENDCEEVSKTAARASAVGPTIRNGHVMPFHKLN